MCLSLLFLGAEEYSTPNESCFLSSGVAQSLIGREMGVTLLNSNRPSRVKNLHNSTVLICTSERAYIC